MKTSFKYLKFEKAYDDEDTWLVYLKSAKHCLGIVHKDEIYEKWCLEEVEPHISLYIPYFSDIQAFVSQLEN